MIRSIRLPRTATVALLVVVCLAACSEERGDARSSTPPSLPAAGGPTATRAAAAESPTGSARSAPGEQYERGRGVYMANCTACHNMDPTKPGGLGPPIQGASHELIEARVLRASYPPGHTPKRDTKLMIALPYLEPEIDALSAYLSAQPQP